MYLTVKHLRCNGESWIGSCETVEYDRRHSPPISVALYSRSGTVEIVVQRGDVVYIENPAGRTVDVIRPAVAPP